MSLRFTVLASGSRGNASLIEAGTFGLLLDAGLGPRQLRERLEAAGLSWSCIHGLLLTHTHSDHWNERTLREVLTRRLPIYCHADHQQDLLSHSASFRELLKTQLVRTYETDQVMMLPAGLNCSPLAVRHDCGATFGFRFERQHDLFSQSAAVGYAADLGCWDDQLAQSLADVDLLAIEFNHDVALEYASGRQPHLIARVLSDEGHLSNVQATALLRAVLRLSKPGRLRHVIQLHLSRDCNHPELAAATARAVLDELRPIPELHTACQDRPLPTLHLPAEQPRAARAARAARPSRPRSPSSCAQRWLPGLEIE